jgi:hypothetical protein
LCTIRLKARIFTKVIVLCWACFVRLGYCKFFFFLSPSQSQLYLKLGFSSRAYTNVFLGSLQTLRGCGNLTGIRREESTHSGKAKVMIGIQSLRWCCRFDFVMRGAALLRIPQPRLIALTHISVPLNSVHIYTPIRSSKVKFCVTQHDMKVFVKPTLT